jgi:hypothetical protein
MQKSKEAKLSTRRIKCVPLEEFATIGDKYATFRAYVVEGLPQ